MAHIGKYRIDAELGRGGMGVVYRAWDPDIDRPVAIKRIVGDFLEQPELFERFKREAQSAGRLSHPNIVTVYEYGKDASPYIVMELIDGKSLKDHLDGGEHYTVREALDITTQLLEALAFAHGHGVIHRDIKPANIMLKADNKVVVADFGIARLATSDLTQTGAAMGTYGYSSPEQINGATVDERADIFSVGVILYLLLTGKAPFKAEFPGESIAKILNTDPAPVSSLSPNVPPGTNAVVARALEKDRTRRYQDARAFIQAIADLNAKDSDLEPPSETTCINTRKDKPFPDRDPLSTLPQARVPDKTETRSNPDHQRPKKWPFWKTALLGVLLAISVLAVGYLLLQDMDDTHPLASKPSPESDLLIETEQGRMPEYRVGKSLSLLLVASRQGGYLYCYYETVNDGLFRLFPNRYQTANRLQAGELKQVVSADSKVYVEFDSPGTETVTCYATDRDVLADLDTAFGPGDLYDTPDIPGGIEALNAFFSSEAVSARRDTLKIKVHN